MEIAKDRILALANNVNFKFGRDVVIADGIRIGDLFDSYRATVSTKPVRIIMDGGLIEEVQNVPVGLTIEVYDYDLSDSDHPNVIKDEEGTLVFHNIYTSEGQVK
jgi:hypothetical protein